MKNKLLLIILAVALFIPSFVAIASYTRTQNAPVTEKNATILTISDLAGQQFTFDKSKDDEGAQVVDFFQTMNNRAMPITSLPDALVGSPFFKVTLSTITKESTYQYYFSTNPDDSYYVAPDGGTFRIDPQDSSKFIVTKYAASMYKEADFPAMMLSGQYNVKPNNAAWNYKNYSQSYTAANLDGVLSSETGSFDIEGGFDMAFSIEPDSVAVKIVSEADGTVIFDDLYEYIGSLSFDRSSSIVVNVTAKWYEVEDRTYYGEAYYTFKTSVSAPAEFYLAKAAIDRGEFVVMSGKNVSSPDKITFSSEPSINYTPKFFKDGEYVNALIPIEAELAAGTYVFTVTYGGVSQNIHFTVNERTFKTQPYSVPQTLLNTYYSDESLAAYRTAFDKITSVTSGERMWKGSFANVLGVTNINNVPIGLGFGHVRTIAGTDLSYRMSGIDYMCSEKTDVLATNDGIVVYKDVLDFSGYTVVIDHGWGLKSWYSHLSNSDVMVGDTVTRGQVIGASGSTGFTTSSKLNFGITVFDKPVCPYKIFEDGEDKGILVYLFND